jgi:hypothetical protein
MSLVRELPPPEWRGYLDELTRRASERTMNVVLRFYDEQMQDAPVGEKLRLAAIELESKGSGAGAITMVLHGVAGDFGHRIRFPARLVTHVRDDGELEFLEIHDRTGTTLHLYAEAHPAFLELSEAKPWWRRPLPPLP